MFQCDSLERCSHCPEQGYDNESDYWKVLGCLREKLREFSKVFCPGTSPMPSALLFTYIPTRLHKINIANIEVPKWIYGAHQPNLSQIKSVYPEEKADSSSGADEK